MGVQISYEKLHSGKTKTSDNPIIRIHYDVLVIGGGMSGLCAAIAAARHGAKTALVQDRSVFGGNASSETRMHISGASCHWGKKNAAETGILMELQLDNKRINDSFNYSIWDGVLWSKARNTENLTIYMNTTMDEVKSDGREIKWVSCYQMTTENRYEMTAGVYIDCTGNGTLGYFAGNEYAIGREAKKTYQEVDAPEKEDGETMGNTIYFVARDTGHPVKFIKPDWAYTFDESDFKHRYHGDITVYHNADDVVILPKNVSYENFTTELVEKYDVKSGYWWIELGGDWDDIIKDSEEIRWELYKTIYGVWDHIKNGGDHGAENYELEWVGNVSGMRESRRLLGTYILTENDIKSNNEREDGVAYGGWPMDEHTAGGFRAKGIIPSKVRSFKGLYNIPYGCYCSKDISNLMFAGRNISASKLAMGSTRVMGTCAVGGQAAGTAAAMAVKAGLTPSAFSSHVEELRQALLKDDCFIPGCRNTDSNDIARKAKVSATSERVGFEAANVINGISRSVGEESNMWASNGMAKEGEVLTLSFEKADVNEVRLTFDPNLSDEKCISVSQAFINKEKKGVPEELVKDYILTLTLDGKTVFEKAVKDNYQRQNIIRLDKSVKADKAVIRISSTNGIEDARVFEVRIY
jgi:Succinate dehydrogenase/fumarate reductase, flavoprotein subunit